MAPACISQPMKSTPSTMNCGERQPCLILVLLPNEDIHLNDLLLVARFEERQEGSDHSLRSDHVDVEHLCHLLWRGGLGAAGAESLYASVVD